MVVVRSDSSEGVVLRGRPAPGRQRDEEETSLRGMGIPGRARGSSSLNYCREDVQRRLKMMGESERGGVL